MIAPIMNPIQPASRSTLTTFGMRVSQIPQQPMTIVSFQKAPNPDLKQLWDRGWLPQVKRGFYGDILTHENVSREHLLPASLGGTKRFGNIALASKEANNARGNADIREFADPKTVQRYLAQFKNVHLKELNGKSYIKAVKQTLKSLGLDI